MSNLVAYFSASGVTRKEAEKLADKLGADLYEIKPQNPYTEDDLKWWVEGNRSVAETLDKDFRPAIVNDDAHIEKYDTIYLGFPIWCYVAPRIINTFLEKYDFSNKKIILFATSGGSSINKANKQFAAEYTALDWKEGKVLNNATKADVEAWVKSLGL